MLSKLGPEMLGLVLVLVATSAIASASAEAKCRSGCGGVVPQTFKFADGTTYQYNFEGAINILLSSSKGQESETKVKATVLLTQQPDCNQVLRVQNLQILGDTKRFGSISDIEKPIKLNYHDGHLEDIICAESGDTQNSLNVKRAIASMFQAALKHHNTEIDIFGSCPTEFSTHKEGNVFVIKKARNLNKCSHRETIGQDYMSLAYDLTSDMKTSPFLQGKYNAEMKIKAGILDSSTVNEDYLYMPFSVGDEGAKVKVHSKLSFVKQTKENPKVSCTVPKSLIFENPHPLIPDKSVSKALSDAIKDAANSIDSALKKDSAEKFAKTVQLMRHAKKPEIITIYGQVRSGAGYNNQQTGRRIFMDALFRAGSGESVEAAMEMFKNNELTLLEAKLFFLRLSFVKHPTVGSIKGATELLGKSDLPREAVIGLGALVRKYCYQQSCDNFPELTGFLDKLASRLAKPTKQNEEQVLSALKALVNTGHTNPTIEGKLMDLAQDKQGVNRIRSAALDAYKANPCSDRLRDSALGMLNDIQQDAEIRIKAYLAVAECPNGKVATNIKNLLDKEESYQVGGYIVSHLQTLRSSTNPDKALAKSQLGNIRTTKKYPIDLLKYSRNLEMSHRWDTIGMGGSLESDIIYSSKSYVPRHTHLNLTTQLFGHTFNFLEIDTRQENLDRLIEHYLGPNGILRKESPNSLYQSGQGTLQKVGEQIKERVQKNIVKREATKAQIETFGKTITRKENELNQDLDLDLSIKMFGSEAIFLSFSEDITKYTPEALVGKILDKVEEQVNKLKNFDENLHGNLIFLDADITYPTSVGFPLKLSVEGISSMNLKTSGKLDIPKLLGVTDGEYKLSLIPSANIQVTSRMIVDTPVVQRGLKLTGNVYTATGGSLDLITSKHNFEMKYSLPLDKQEIVTATHEIVFESKEPNGQVAHVGLKQTQAKDVTVCLDQLNPYVGVVLCAHVNQPNVEGNQVILPYPLNGNSKFSITVENTDLKYIKFQAASHHDPNVLKTGIEMETTVMSMQNKPKSTWKTEIFTRPEMYFLSSFNSDRKKASAELRAVITQQEYSVFGKATVDELEYYAKLGAFVSGTPERTVYKPIMEYKAGTGNVQKSPYRIEGQIIKERQGDTSKYTLDNVQLVGGPKPIKINGNVMHSVDSLATDITVAEGDKNAHLNGKIHYRDRHWSLNAMMKTNFNPNANFHVKYDVKIADDLFDSNLQFQQGDLTKKDNIFKLQNMFKRGDKEILPFSTKNHMSYPKLGIDNKFDLDLALKTVKMDVEFGYQKTKINMELDAKVNTKSVGDYDVEFEFEGMNTKIELDMQRAVDKSKSKLKNSLEVNGKSIKLNGDVVHIFDTNKIDFATDLNLKIAGFPQHNADLKIISALKHNPHETDGSLKISEGSKVMVDAFIKHSKGGNANGSLKVNTNTVNMQGQLKATKYSGTSDLTIDIPKVRKMKAESTFNFNLPTLKLDFTLLTDVGKDDSRKYQFTTNSVIKPDAIDTKNTLDILGKTTTFNLKGTGSGDIMTGKVDGHFDLTLPNDMYFTGKINRDRKVLKGVASGTQVIELEQRDNKNTPGRKITIKGVGKNVDFSSDIYDIVYNIIYENGNGKNLNIDLDFKGTKEGSKRTTVWTSHIHGAAIAEPFKSKVSLAGEHHNGQFGINFEHGKSTSLDVHGKYDHHHTDNTNKPCTGDISIELHTPLSKFRVFKMKSDVRALIPKTKEDTLELWEEFSLFIDDDGTDPKPTVDFESKQDWKLGLTKGTIKSMLHSKDKDPLNIDLSYDEVHGKKYNYKGDVKCGSGSYGKFDVTFEVPAKNNINVDCKIESSNEKLKKLDVKGKLKYVPESKMISEEYDVLYNGEKYHIASSLRYSEHYPMFSVELKYPDGKMDKISAEFNDAGTRSVSATADIQLHKIPFVFGGDLDVHAENIEDFDLKLNLNSPQLKLDKISITANTKETKGNNKLIVSVKKGNENLISGNAVYKTREEDGKFVVEGSGTFTIKNDKKSGNFKYTKSNLVMSKHKEDGVEFSLQGSIGDKALDSEIKITDKHRRALLSYCEQKKDCANMDLDSKTTTEGKDGFRNVLEMNVDLRKLGMSHEFGLKSETKANNWDLDHTMDLHFQSQKSKYSYNLYLHPTKSGATLTTPKRIVSLESTLTKPELGQKGPISGTIMFFANKKTKPNEKTLLQFSVNPEFSDKVANLNMEAKLIHPALKKPMSTTYKSTLSLQNPYKLEMHGEIDVVPNSDRKVVMNAKGTLAQTGNKMELKHNFNLDIQPLKLKLSGDTLDITDLDNKIAESKYELTIESNGKKSLSMYHDMDSPTKIFEKLTINNYLIYDVNFDMKFTKEEQTVDGQIDVIGLEKRLAHLEIKNLNTLKFFLTKAATKNPKLEVSAAVIPNQIADFRFGLQKDGKKIDFVHASVKLDESNFLKSDYAFEGKNLEQHFVEYLKKMNQKVVEEMKNAVKKTTEDAKTFASEMAKEVQANQASAEPLLDYYRKELKALKTELESDQSLKEINEALATMVNALIHFTNDMYKIADDFTMKVTAIIQKNIKDLGETFEKEILPKLKEIADKLTDAGYKFFEKTNEVLFNVMSQITSFLEAHKEELRQIATVLTSITQDINRFIVKVSEEIKQTLTLEWEKILEEIKALPYYDQIKTIVEKIKKGEPVPQQVIDQFVGVMNEIMSQIHAPIIKDIVDYATKYIVKKMKNEEVNDLEALQHIVKMIAEAINELSRADGLKEMSHKVPTPLTSRIASFIPKFVIMQYSWLNRLAGNDYPTIHELLMDSTLNPLSWLPPFKRYAIIAQGQHIFTFDGRHLTFPGKCNYMLAKDIEGHFSLVGTYSNGIMTELTFFDSSDTITIKKSGVSTLNEAATELPIRTKTTQAFRLYDQVHISSKVGIKVFCATDLSVCVVSASGFYHDRLRGLLGNANHERFDDYILPNGKIVQSESDFGNAYKMQTNCPMVKTVDHSTHHHEDRCTLLFNYPNTLSFCNPIVNPETFRQACDHGIAAKIPNTIETIATAYAAACMTRFAPAALPHEFITCPNADKPYKVGEKFNVKLPQKSADIVFVLDVTTANKQTYTDLVMPLGEQLKKELSERGVKDAEFHIVTYGDHPEYPSHITTNGGKLSFKGKFPNLKFADAAEEDDIETGIKQVDFFLSLLKNYLHDIELALGETPRRLAFEEAMNYPFRANAVKAVVVVATSPCETGSLLWAQKLYALLLHDPTVTIHVFMPMQETNFKVKDDKTTKNVIGFNKDAVLTFPDCKKKPTGNPDLVKDVSYNDYCSEYTVMGGGNVFVLDNFTPASKANKKFYTQVASYNIAETMLAYEQGLDCECEREDLLYGRNKCKIVQSKKKPASDRKMTRG